MDKPLKDWTLKECVEKCRRKRSCKNCILSDKGICGYKVTAWDLYDPPRWTEQEVEYAKWIKRVLMCDFVSRKSDSETLTVVADNSSVQTVINRTLFPSLQRGETVKLDDIIGGAE